MGLELEQWMRQISGAVVRQSRFVSGFQYPLKSPSQVFGCIFVEDLLEQADEHHEMRVLGHHQHLFVMGFSEPCMDTWVSLLRFCVIRNLALTP